MGMKNKKSYNFLKLISSIGKHLKRFFSRISHMGIRNILSKKEKKTKKRNNSVKNPKKNPNNVGGFFGKKRKGTKVDRFNGNPIMSPNSNNSWEAWQTFNPAAIKIDGIVHFLYRAIGEDGMSRFGYANSKDGFNLDKRFPDPVYEHDTLGGPYKYYSYVSGGSFGGCEDPRMVRVGNEDKIYVTYTACDGGLRIGLASIKVEDFVKGKWNWEASQIISPPGEIHKNWVIFPEKINGKYAILHSISPKISVAYRDTLDFKEGEYINSYYNPGKANNGRWDSFVRGPGPPPLKTEHGWLLFYHAMNHKDMGNYKIGAMLLDLEDPTKVLYRSENPVMVPEKIYENDGFKSGVIYASGAVIKNGKIIIYYGGADSYVCAAYTDCEKFLEALMQKKKKPLKTKLLKFFRFSKKKGQENDSKKI